MRNFHFYYFNKHRSEKSGKYKNKKVELKIVFIIA